MHLDRTGPSPLLPAVEYVGRPQSGLQGKRKKKRVNSKYIQCEKNPYDWCNYFKEKGKLCIKKKSIAHILTPVFFRL